MARLAPVPPEEMDAAQRAMFETVAAQRGGGQVRGPFALLLHAPDIGARVADMVEHFLSETRVPHRLKELAIIAVARRYGARYEWFIHARRALQAGLDETVVEAVRRGESPAFADPAEAAAFGLACEIAEAGTVSDETYESANAALGEPATLELVSLAGFYVMVAVVLNAYRVEIPDGGPDPFEGAPVGRAEPGRGANG